jgi:hypothetical protein
MGKGGPPESARLSRGAFAFGCGTRGRLDLFCEVLMGSVIKKRRKRMAKKKHRKLLRKTRHQRRNKK